MSFQLLRIFEMASQSFTKSDGIEAKIKIEHKTESKHEINKDWLFKNEIKNDFKTKNDFEEFKIKMKGDCNEKKDVKPQKIQNQTKS